MPVDGHPFENFDAASSQHGDQGRHQSIGPEMRIAWAVPAAGQFRSQCGFQIGEPRSFIRDHFDAKLTTDQFGGLFVRGKFVRRLVNEQQPAILPFDIERFLGDQLAIELHRRCNRAWRAAATCIIGCCRQRNANRRSHDQSAGSNRGLT